MKMPHFKKKRIIVPLLSILLILLVFSFWRGKREIEEYGEKWLLDFIKRETNLEVIWDRLKLGTFLSPVTISGLKILAEGLENGPQAIVSCNKLVLNLDPIKIIKDKLFEINNLNIIDLELYFNISELKDISKLKGLLSYNKRDKAKKEGEWSFKISRITLNGKQFSLYVTKKGEHFFLWDFTTFLKGLDKGGPYSFQLGFREGRVKWRGLNRDLGAGEIKGRFDREGLYLDSSKTYIMEEGEVKWSGTIKKQGDKPYIDGNYSLVLLCDTLSHFLSPFKQMEGKISSHGSIRGVWKQLQIGGYVESPDFFWRDYNFKEVKGDYSYFASTLGFRGFECKWRDGLLNIESQVFIKDKRAHIGIKAKNLPTLSLYKKWRDLFPVDPPLWEGNIDWGITWPQKRVKNVLDISMKASLLLPDKVMINPEGRAGQMDSGVDSKAKAPRDILLKTRFSSQGSRIEFEDIAFNLGGNSIKADGYYKRDEKIINMQYECVIRERGLIWQIWNIPLTGTGDIKGRMDGPLSKPELQGEISAEDASIKGYDADHLVMDYSFQNAFLYMENINGRLKNANFSGRGNITLPTPREGTELELHLEARSLPVSEVLAHIPYNLAIPYDGSISGEGDLRIKKGKAEFHGAIKGGEIALYGQEGIRCSIEKFFVSPDRISFHGISLQREGSAISGEISYQKEKGMLLTGTGSSWAISPVALPSGGKIPVKGILDFDISGRSGVLSGRFSANGFSYKDIKIPVTFSGNMGFKGGQLDAAIDYPWGEGQIKVSLDGQYPFIVNAQFARFPISDPGLGLVDPNSKYSALMDGNLELEGELKDMESVKGHFMGSGITISGPFGELENTGDFAIILKDKELSIPSLNMLSENGQLKLSGLWHPDTGFDLNAIGYIPLEFFQKRFKKIKALSGTTQVNLNLKGRKDQPRFHGEIYISKGGFSVPEYNFRVDNILSRIILRKDYASIERFSAETRGGGWIELAGRLEYRDISIRSFNLKADFEDIYLYKRDVYRAFIEGSLEWSKHEKSSEIRGTILLGEARHTGYKNILQLILAKKRDVDARDIVVQEKTQRELGEIIENTNLNIELDLGDDFWITSPFYNASLSGALLIKGKLTSPWIYGDVEVVEGDAFIGSQSFELASGRIKLTNPEMAEPTINVVALRDINSLRIMLSVFGPLKGPKLQFSSVPYMSQQKILNMVFFGLSSQEGDGTQRESDILSLMLSTTSKVIDDVFGEMTSYYTGLDILRPDNFPIDLFKVDIIDFKLRDENGEIERLTLGKTISRRLKIKFSRLSGQEEREIAEAEYRISDYFTLIASQDNQGIYSLDLNFGFRF